MADYCTRCGKPIPLGARDCACGIDLGGLEIEGLEPRAPRPVRPAPRQAVVRPEDVDFGDDTFVGGAATPGSHGGAGSGGGNLFGAEVELDDSMGGPSLELDDDRPLRARRAAPEDAASRAPSSIPPPIRHALDQTSGAAGTPGEVGSEQLAAARRLAAYGVCAGPLQAPGYALRVRKRQAQLRAEVKRLSEAVLVAEGEAEESMARIALCIRDAAARDATLAPLVDAVVHAEAQAKDRELAVIAADTSSAVLSDVVKQRIGQVHARLMPSREELDRLLPELRTRKEAHRRVLAQVRRSEIELRNLRDLANAKDTEASAQTETARKGALAAQAAELRGRSPDYEAVLASHRAAATEMEGPIGDLERSMQQLRREITDGEAEIAKLQAGQQREAAALDRAKDERMSILGAARVTVRNRLAEVARVAIAKGFAAGAIAPMLPEARTLAGRAALLRRDLELYSTALEVHDRPRVQQGLLMMGGGAASMLIALIALLGSC